MIRHLVTILAVLLLSATAAAQTTLHGKVKEKASGDAMPFVNVIVKAKGGTTVVKAGVSDTEGNFSVTGIKPGNYTVSVSYVGYKAYTKEIKAAGQKINLGTIALEEDSRTLGEAKVVGTRQAVKLEVDRKSFDVSQDITNAGGSASDALENIPSVEVDQDGNVSLRGNSSVEVWINGRKSGLTSDNRGDILKQLPAESIERIEVIDNPSAKFSAEGSAGIINIVLKKNLKAGYYGSLVGGGSTRGGAQASANINYNSSKFDVFANVGYRHMQNRGKSQSEQTNFGAADDGSDTYSNYATRNNNRGNMLFSRAGLTWHATKADDIGLSTNQMFGGHNRYSLTPYHYGTVGQSTDDHTQFRHTSEDGTMRMQYYELNYRHTFSETHFLDIVGNYSQWNADHDEFFRDSTVYFNAAKPKEEAYSCEPLHIRSNAWQFKADYENQLSKAVKLQAGYQADLSRENTPVAQETADNWEGVGATVDKNYYNRFIYDMDIHALYASASWMINDKFSAQGGLRGEYWHVATDSYDYEQDLGDKKKDPTYKKDFFELFPSAFLSYQLTKTQQLQLNYTRRLRRPHAGELNSFMNTSDASLVHYGNPELTPEFSNSFALNYLKEWEKHSLLLSAYYRPTTDVMSHVSYRGNDGRIFQTVMNTTQNLSSGVEATMKNKLFKILDLTTTTNFYYKKVDGFDYVGIDPLNATNPINVHGEGSERFTWNARMQASLILPWDVSVQVSGRYRSKEIEAQGYRKANFSMEAGVRKNFCNKLFTLAINCRDVLNSRRWESFTNTETFTRHQLNRWGGRTVNFTLTYNFGNAKAKPKKQRPGNEADDHDDEEGGTGFGGY